MAGKKTKMFRTQMGGFHKDDVNNYIKETDLRHSEELENLKIKIGELNAEIANLSDKCAALAEGNALLLEEKNNAEIAVRDTEAVIGEKNAEIADISKKLDFYKTESEAQINVMNNLKTENKRLEAELEDAKSNASSGLNDEISRLTALNTEKDAIIVSLNDELERVNAENISLNEKAKASDDFGDVNDHGSDAYKLEMYNKISSQLGDIIINANRNADDIVSAAKADADKIIADAQIEGERRIEESTAEANYTRERIAQISSSILASVSGELHGNIENCMKEITTCIDDMQYEIKTLMTKLSARSSEMNDKVAYYQNTATESVDQKLTKMDEEYNAVIAHGEAENV
ncbi:MAG: hypothetical protein E7628_01475 [Ruminococcaceae bacterium]|nr:hypothetical protein [Oscillospiraceae bacterium]